MYISLHCLCGAHCEVETDAFEDTALMVMHRFLNAHEKHGFATGSTTDTHTNTGIPGRQVDEHTAE